MAQKSLRGRSVPSRIPLAGARGSEALIPSRDREGAVVNSNAGRHTRAKPAAAPKAQTELVIITGLSGSGKGTVLKAFEDLGYYSVDNLPIELIPKFAELTKRD